MITRLLEIDELTGTRELFHYDEMDDSFTIETVNDIEPLIEVNKAQYNEREVHTRHGDMTLIASIPMDIYFAEKRKGTWDDPASFSRFINDRDNAVFRTRPGRY